MALLDRFRAVSPHKHPDPAIRLAYVEALPIEDRDQLATFAREDDDARVRRAAVAKLMEPSALEGIARDDRDEAVRSQAVEMLRDIALDAFEGLGERHAVAAVEALRALCDGKTLALVAKSAAREALAQAALAGVADVGMLGSIARHAASEPVRRAALGGLQDHGEVVAVAMNSDFKDTALAALDRLSDRADLEQVAGRARNKSAAKRARAALRELDERAAAEAAAAPPPPPDPAVIARAECLHIVQRIEALRPVADPQGVEAALQQAEAAWASIEDAAESSLAARFAAAIALVRERLDETRMRTAERQRALDRAAAATRARTALLDRMDGLTGRSALEELAGLREEWSRLDRLVDPVAAASFEQRLGQAVRAFERRYAAWKEGERVRVRLAELAEAADSAAGDPDLASARRRFAVARLEWADLTAAAAQIDPALAARFAAAEARLSARDAEAHETEARARREGLARLQQLAARVERLVAASDPTLKAAERALHDARGALTDVPPLPSKRDHDEIVGRLKAAQSALTPRVHELREMQGWKRFANLGAQEQLCARMEAVRALENPEDIARQIRDLQQQWRQVAGVPRARGEPLWRRFNAAHDEAWARCEAHFAQQAEVRAANLAGKIALCERTEELAGSTSWIQTAEQIKRLQAEWKTIGPVGHRQEKAVWERFRAACDSFFTRRHEDLAQRKVMWAENLARRDALCAKAEALAESTDWDLAAAEIKRLQAEWKTVGPVKKTRSEAIWQRFRGAADRFFTRYAQRHDIARAERVAAREAICAELEALAPAGDAASEPSGDLVASVRAIRGRWERETTARGVDRERAALLDHRFQDAFDRVIAGWPAAFGGTDLDPEANRKRMEALVKRMEDLAASLLHGGTGGSDEALSPTTRLAAMLKEALAANTIGGKVDEESRWRAAQQDVRQVQESWSRIGPVADGARRALSDRFERVCRRVMERR